MDCSRCFAWLFEMSWKVASIAVIQAAMSSSMVTSASPIFSGGMKLRPWRRGLFVCGNVRAVCAIMSPPLGDLRAVVAVLVSLVSVATSASAMVTLRPWKGRGGGEEGRSGDFLSSWSVAFPSS